MVHIHTAAEVGMKNISTLVGKDLKGSGSSIIKVLSRYLPAGTEEFHK
jgi:hypothetical protein